MGMQETLQKTKAAIVAEEQNVVLPFDVAPGEEYFIESIGEVKRKPFYSFLKRFFDIFASGLALILLFVPMLILAVIIKATSKGKVFYTQERLGYKGKKFKLIKFRSMREDAEKLGAQWSAGDDDPRITKVGRFLRKTRLDELPQLINIFMVERTNIYNSNAKHRAFSAF